MEESPNFIKRLIEFGENVQIQLYWVEVKSTFPEHMPMKTVEGMKIQMALFEFCKKNSIRLNNEIDKTKEKCIEFYIKISEVHDQCQISLAAQTTDIPNKDQHLAYMQDIIQDDVQYIQKMEITFWKMCVDPPQKW